MKEVTIKLNPCRVCGAEDSQIITNCGGGFRPWSIYCNSCGKNEAEVYDRTKLGVVVKWNEDKPDKTVPLLKPQYLTEGYDPKLIRKS